MDAFDARDESLFVVAGIDEPSAGLVESTDGACGEDARSVGAIEEEGGEAEGEIVSIGARFKDCALFVPLTDSDLCCFDELDEFIGVSSYGAPEGRDAGVDIIDVDVGDAFFVEEA
ncbi:Uncharacterised protein [Chlamydia trachomatis]|nr:Uncharacterised protein [Chlamydia trachomatis]